MTENPSNHVFILGCERSGSTWLSNVLDSHPNIEFFMEPFADYTNLFPGFPGRNLYIDHCDNAITKIIYQGYENLPKTKYLLMYKRHRNLAWKRIDKFLTKTLIGLCNLRGSEIPLRIKQFQLLNLNLMDVPINWQVKKNDKPSLVVTKELRLNFKIGFLKQAFPRAKYVITVRHPGAQVESILKLIQRGHLGELRTSLLSFFDDLGKSDRFRNYSIPYNPPGNERDLLLLWWLVNYQTVIEDCKHYGVDFMTVFNEDLSASPEQGYEELFAFLETDFSQKVKTYLTQSTSDTLARGSKSVISPTDTTRNSFAYSEESISNLDDDAKLSISNVFDNNPVISEFTRYRGLLNGT